MFAAHFLEPARCLGSALEVKTPGVENRRQRHLAHHHRHNLGFRVEALEDRHQLFTLTGADQVDLAEQDDVGKLDLLDQQVGNRAIIVFTHGFTACGQAVCRLVIEQEVHAVDYGDHGVQARQVHQAFAGLVAEGEGFGHGQRLGDSCGFDQ